MALNDDEPYLVHAFRMLDPLQHALANESLGIVVRQKTDITAGQDQGRNRFLIGGGGLAAQAEAVRDFHVGRVEAEAGVIVVLQFLPAEILMGDPE